MTPVCDLLTGLGFRERAATQTRRCAAGPSTRRDEAEEAQRRAIMTMAATSNHPGKRDLERERERLLCRTLARSACAARPCSITVTAAAANATSGWLSRMLR
jgi:hypothetical protein